MADFVIQWAPERGMPEISHETGHRAFSAALADLGLWVAGYWRADNAAQLRERLGLDAGSAPESILAAGWRQWGETLAERLHGPFAFGLFDAGKRQLFAARDAMGVEPLFLARSSDRVALANNPRRARAAAGLASQPDPETIAGYLRGNFADAIGTFHQGLTRIPPGHCARIDASLSPARRAYFDLTAIPSRDSAPDAAEHFRDLLDREIAIGAAEASRAGVLLSGGLDSSAIAGSIAHDDSLASKTVSLSMVFDKTTRWADRPHLEAIRAACPIAHHERDCTRHDPMTHMAELLVAVDGPSLGSGASSNVEMYALARELGVTTLFSGHGGDEVVSYGLGRINELARAGQWLDVWRESEGAAHFLSLPRWRVFERYLQHKHSWRALRRLLRKLKPQGAAAPAPGADPESLVLPDLARAHPAAPPRNTRVTSMQHTERDLHEHALLQPMQPHALETLTLSARHFDIDLAMPFYSRALVEYSVSLPSHWKLRGGQTRYVLREAMRPRVPESVAGRHDKNDFSANLIENTLASEAIRDLARADNGALAGYVNAQHLKDIWARVEQDQQTVSVFEARALWMAAVLALWLDSDRDACLRD